MGNLIDRVSGRKRSAISAKERLQLVLIHDRTDLTQTALEELKDDLIAVIARHVDIDPDAVRINVERNGREQRLVADIPLKGVTHHRGG
ncbi:MAG: cell division topological specificity factor MinE [Anaerolineae bacterium]|nr:cell division topological specificity factor MinE [Anaerolineae bacterium]MDK1080446.1 cell division topological specificity factor MinE [Anaerolineae bacterium]MDK1119049.1 cell division topological specificity factor MinE [Anaerolineae bacterium]